jgi:two-component system response regulator YesN
MTKFNMIIVDDEPIIRKGLQKLVEASGRPIETIRLAASAEEALRMIAELPPHFVLTDIRMSDMDGLELCRCIQKSQQPIQTVIISGFGEFHYAQKSVSYGVKEYLLKPVQQLELEKVLDKLIEQAKASSQQRGSSILSIRDCEAFMERIGQGVWDLQKQDLDIALQEWQYYVGSLHLNVQQIVTLLGESMQLVIKYLNTKDIYPFTAEQIQIDETEAEAGRAERAYEQFESILRRIFAELLGKRKGKTIDPIEAAKEYIDTHLNQEVSLEEVADYLGLNPSYFSQLFKQMTKETFVHYRIKKRLEQAKRLLEIPHYRMSDVALEVGYLDYSHFAKSFKKMYALSPTEYRIKLGID